MLKFTDYVTLMLVNMAAGLAVLAVFLVRWPPAEKTAPWAPAFGIAGLVAVACGLHMIFTWPLPQPYNIPYGELSILLGVLFLGAAWSLAKGWSLLPLTIYAFFAGVTAVVMGVRFISLGLTQAPVPSGIGFILTGLGGVFAAAAVLLQKFAPLRWAGALVMLLAALIWFWTGLMAYWMHVNIPDTGGG